MALAVVETTNSPTAKHRKSSFGFESSYEKRWDSVIQLQALQKKTPHRYQQSPVFTRKVLSCPSGEVENRHRRRRPRRHQTTHGARRRHCTSESDSAINKSEERVHLLAELPWRKSPDHSSDDSCCDGDAVNNKDFSLHLPNELNNKLKSQMNRTRTMSPLFMRRENQRARSQGSSPLAGRSCSEDLSHLAGGNVQYNAKLKIGVYPVYNESHPDHILTPEEDVETPQPGFVGFLRIPSLEVTADSDEPTFNNHENVKSASNGLLQVPTLDGSDESLPPPPSPETLRRFLGLETEPIPEKGLSEHELLISRLMTRRFSSSSDSSTSTLT